MDQTIQLSVANFVTKNVYFNSQVFGTGYGNGLKPCSYTENDLFLAWSPQARRILELFELKSHISCLYISVQLAPTKKIPFTLAKTSFTP